MASYSTKFDQEDVTIDDVEYVVRELTGAGSEAYMELIGSKGSIVAEPDPDNPGEVKHKLEMQSFSGLQIPLICSCLRTKDGNKAVDQKVVGEWPQRVIKDIHAVCLRVCKMDVVDAAAAAQEDAGKK